MLALGPYTCKQTCDAHLRSRLVCYDELGGLQLNIFRVKNLTEKQKGNSEIFHWCDLTGTQRDSDELRGVHWTCLKAARMMGPYVWMRGVKPVDPIGSENRAFVHANGKFQYASHLLEPFLNRSRASFGLIECPKHELQNDEQSLRKEVPCPNFHGLVCWFPDEIGEIWVGGASWRARL